MAHLNHRGPEEEGPKTGRMLGKCHKTEDEKRIQKTFTLGKGMGKQKKTGCNKGKGDRLKSAKIFD